MSEEKKKWYNIFWESTSYPFASGWRTEDVVDSSPETMVYQEAPAPIYVEPEDGKE